MQQYVDVGDSHMAYERKVQKKTSLFYKQAQEESEKFQKTYEKDVNKLAIFDEFPELKEYMTHFEERNSRFYHRLDRIMTLEQSIKDFSKGYKKYGIFKLEQGLFYRDWAPEAEQITIAGEFNEWQKEQYQCTQEGQDWEVTIDSQPQNSKYLIYLKKNGDFSKISCWTRQIISENNQLFGVLSDGYYEFQNQNVKADISKSIIEIDYQEDKVQDILKNIEGPKTILLKGIISNVEGKVLAYLAPNGDCLKIKQLVDYCHSKNISVIVEFPLELWKDSPLVNWDGSSYHYFQQGIAESHMDFEKWELNRYLFSALGYWMNEFKIDGFNFPNLERIICTQQHIKQDLKYLLIDNSNIDGLLFLMFANDLVHQLNENAITIGSGVPEEYPCYTTIKQGGIGFDAFNIKFDKI